MKKLIENAVAKQRKYASQSTTKHRRDYGQVFTPPEIARYMASLFNNLPNKIQLLDPGSGYGILSLAFCERITFLKTPRKIELHLVETDHFILSELSVLLDKCKNILSSCGHDMSYTIHEMDFIEAASPHLERSLFKPKLPDTFNIVITNPPYFKLRKDSQYARLMSRIVHGQPNAYAFFLALSARLLKPDGQIIAISPRSFCNGLYFRGFRKWFLKHASLDHIHLFESRTDAFKDSGILQESVITKWHRLGTPSKEVSITHSWGKDLGHVAKPIVLASEEIISLNDEEQLIKIPVSTEEIEIKRAVESLPYKFMETGLRISTGPVVMFRATKYLRDDFNGEAIVPFLLPQNVKTFKTLWPVEKKNKPIGIVDCEKSQSILVPNKNYVLLKRFSAKEEKRRLTASCLFYEMFNYKRIGLENHLNYIYHAERELTINETYGIAAFFNSRMIDRYFRIISGNTQVNATEIRTLRFPPLDIISSIGKIIQELKEHKESKLDKIIEKSLGVNFRDKRHE